LSRFSNQIALVKLFSWQPKYSILVKLVFQLQCSALIFLPRCMEGQRGLATRKLSVCLSCLPVRPSACLSNAWVVTKRKKDLSRFLYHTKDQLGWYSEKNNGWWGCHAF